MTLREEKKKYAGLSFSSLRSIPTTARYLYAACLYTVSHLARETAYLLVQNGSKTSSLRHKRVRVVEFRRIRRSMVAIKDKYHYS